jgi:hypothetical protein
MEQLTLMDTDPILIEIALDAPDFVIDWTIQQRVDFDTAKVEEYTGLYREGHDLEHITLFYDGESYRVGDGFHRVTAAREAGLAMLPAMVYPGGRREALLYATSCNKHGKPLTNADKRQRVLTLLQDAEWCLWSDNHIARHCGVAHSFVRKLRDQLSVDSESSEHGDTETSQPATRQYVNKYGQVTTMQVGAIGHRNGQAACADCGRPLTDAESSNRGVGPVCACKQQLAPTATASATPRREDTSEQTTRETIHRLREQSIQQTDALARMIAASEPPALDSATAYAPAQSLSEMFARTWRTLMALDEWLDALLQQGEETVPSLVRAYQSDITLLQQATERLMARLSMPAPVEAPAAPTTGRPPGYGALPAKVREAMQAHRKRGITAGALATKLDAPRKQVWATLERFVTQGKAQKNGTAYHWVA